MENMELIVSAEGVGRCVYSEHLELSSVGRVSICRASHVEPAGDGWTADLRPVGGPVLGPFARRSEALAAELKWLGRHWLGIEP